jgi:hypothetical protein
MKTPVAERQASRKKLTRQGHALKDGSYPIPNVSYLKKAIKAKGRTKPEKWPALKKLIRKEGKRLGAMNIVNKSWAGTGAKVGLAGGYSTASSTDGPRVTKGTGGHAMPSAGEMDRVYKRAYAAAKSKGNDDATCTRMAMAACRKYAKNKGYPASAVKKPSEYSNHGRRGRQIDLVGPKGYEHGWRYVGGPGLPSLAQKLAKHRDAAKKIGTPHGDAAARSLDKAHDVLVGKTKIGPEDQRKASRHIVSAQQSILFHDRQHPLNGELRSTRTELKGLPQVNAFGGRMSDQDIEDAAGRLERGDTTFEQELGAILGGRRRRSSRPSGGRSSEPRTSEIPGSKSEKISQEHAAALVRQYDAKQIGPRDVYGRPTTNPKAMDALRAHAAGGGTYSSATAEYKKPALRIAGKRMSKSQERDFNGLSADDKDIYESRRQEGLDHAGAMEGLGSSSSSVPDVGIQKAYRAAVASRKRTEANPGQAMAEHEAAKAGTGTSEAHSALLKARSEARKKHPQGHPERLRAERAVRQSRKARKGGTEPAPQGAAASAGRASRRSSGPKPKTDAERHLNTITNMQMGQTSALGRATVTKRASGIHVNVNGTRKRYANPEDAAKAAASGKHGPNATDANPSPGEIHAAAVIHNNAHAKDLPLKDLLAADAEFKRRADALGRPGQISKSHKAVRDEMAHRVAKMQRNESERRAAEDRASGASAPTTIHSQPMGNVPESASKTSQTPEEKLNYYSMLWRNARARQRAAKGPSAMQSAVKSQQRAEAELRKLGAKLVGNHTWRLPR